MSFKPCHIYLASSWRNKEQPTLIKLLRGAGHQVYDFRDPPHGKGGFEWRQIDPAWETWTAAEYRQALLHPIARIGFAMDFAGMSRADTCVLLLPSGRSAHLEAGWMAGKGKRVLILMMDGEEPELMALLASRICINTDELLEALQTTPWPTDRSYRGRQARAVNAVRRNPR